MQHLRARTKAFDMVGISVCTSFEDGFDQLFVQSQVGHRWGSSTAGYTKVGSDFLQAALARALRPALGETH
jgi:hypothetical protein